MVTVAILAQGTHWAVASMQAFFVPSSILSGRWGGKGITWSRDMVPMYGQTHVQKHCQSHGQQDGQKHCQSDATRPSSLQRLRTRVVFDAYTQRVTRDATPHRDDAQDMRGHVCMRAGVSSQWKQHSYEVELQHSNQNPKCWHLHLTMHLYSMVSEHEPTPV